MFARLTASSADERHARVAVIDDLGQRLDTADHKCLLHRHRFERFERRDELGDAVIGARHDEDIDRAVVAKDVAVGDPAREDRRAVIKPELSRGSDQVGPLLPVADDEESYAAGPDRGAARRPGSGTRSPRMR